MVRLISSATLGFLIGACTELPPASEGMDGCGVPQATTDIETGTDRVQMGRAVGEVSGNCLFPECAGNEPGDDPVDLWLVTTCTSRLEVALDWTDENSDLDLYVLDSGLDLIASATHRSPNNQEIVVVNGLTEGDELFVEVQAYQTVVDDGGPIPETYNLRVTSH